MTENFKTVKYEQIILPDIIKEFNKKSEENLAFKKLSELYSLKKKEFELRNFRSTPYVFDKIKLNWIIISEEIEKENKDILAGHAITCEINWQGSVEDLPENGWSGATLRCYKNNNKKINTLVGLFIHIEKNYKNKQLSKVFIENMKKIAIEKNYELVIPLRPPTRFEKEFCEISFDEFCKLKTSDGFFQDYWIRQHQKFGAEYLSFCEKSHQHKIPLKIFKHFFGKNVIKDTGHYTVNILGGWYKVFFDLKKDEVTINQGCVWVKHDTT